CTRCAGSCDLTDILRRNTADSDNGDRDRVCDCVEPVDTDGFFADVLGPRAEHGAAADVVGAVLLCAPGGFRVVGRKADQQVRCDPARGMNRQVVRPEVHAVGTGCERDVHAVVDEQERAVATHERVQLTRFLEERGGSRGLVAQLNRGRTRIEGGGHDVGYATRRGECDVGDDDEPQVERWAFRPGRAHGVPVVSARGAAFRAAARSRCAAAFARLCSASERVNTWLPSGRATKYRWRAESGASTASIARALGEAIGPGGSPRLRYVLYGLSATLSIAAYSSRSRWTPRAYCTVGSAWSGIPMRSRL